MALPNNGLVNGTDAGASAYMERRAGEQVEDFCFVHVSFIRCLLFKVTSQNVRGHPCKTAKRRKRQGRIPFHPEEYCAGF